MLAIHAGTIRGCRRQSAYESTNLTAGPEQALAGTTNIIAYRRLSRIPSRQDTGKVPDPRRIATPPEIAFPIRGVNVDAGLISSVDLL